MIRWLNSILAILVLSFPLGCRQDSEPPPRPQAGGSAAALPVRIPEETRDRSILGQAAERGEDFLDEGAGEAEGPEITIDDSTAEGIAQAFVDIAAANAFDLLPDILVPSQAEVMAEVLEALRPALEVGVRLKQLLDEKFPDHNIPITVGTNTLGGEVPEVADVEEVDENEARATLESESGASLTLTLRRIDEAWRVELPSVPPAAAVPQMTPMFTRLAEGLEELATKVENDEFADEQAVQDELKRITAPMMAQPQGM